MARPTAPPALDLATAYVAAAARDAIFLDIAGGLIEAETICLDQASRLVELGARL